MALKIIKNLNVYGENIKIETYAKIISITGNKEKIKFYLEHQKFNNNSIIIDTEQHSFVPIIDSSDNFIKQGYLYLKTLEEYKDAIDC